MRDNELGDEISGRIEAVAWFILDLADELESRGCIDGDQLLRRLRARDTLDDQLEYMRRAQNHLGKLASIFETGRQTAGQKPVGAASDQSSQAA